MSPRADRAWCLLVALYLGGILAANATAAKLVHVAGVHVTTGALAIPLVYLTTDLLNELHGPAATRAVVWMGFVANLVLVGMSLVAGAVPASHLGASQGAFDAMFRVTPRIVLASQVAYLASSFVDVWAFNVLRAMTEGRHFWLRKNGSTVLSQAVDSGLFAVLAFGGLLPARVLYAMAMGQYLVKMAAAPLGTPLSYAVLRIARSAR